jgi:hypothetical protein
MGPMLMSLVLGVGCGGDEEEATPDAWECTEERDRWERCEGGEVVWCHAFGTPHFHGGAKCAQLGLECMELSDRRAVCTDGSASCDPGSFSCEGNTALNCEGGVLAREPCGTLKRCLADEEAGLATCWDDRPNASCSGHGDLFRSGCVCHRGYVPGPMPNTCVPG